jgi:hypothetical protein
MHFKMKIMLCMLLWGLLGATNALAQGHQHEHHAHHNNQSPFEQNKPSQSLHCQLKGHTTLDFCPHSKPESSENNLPSISVDCGGKTSGAIPSVSSFSNDFAEIEFLSPSHYVPVNKLAPSTSNFYHRFIESLDPPPRLI